MANSVLYVDSAATGTGDGSSWTNAYTTLAAAITASGTGGTDFYVASTYSQSASGITLTFKGLAATPDRVFSTDKTNSPPKTSDLTIGATFSTTTSSQITIVGYVYIYGCTFQAGSSSSNTAINLSSTGAADITLDSCGLYIASTGSSSPLNVGNSSTTGVRITWINTSVRFSNAGNTITLGGGTFRWFNTSPAIVGATLPTTLLKGGGSTRTQIVLCEGVDLSALTSKALTDAYSYAGSVQFVNCNLASGYTVGVPAVPAAAPVDIIISGSSVTNYNQERHLYQGTLTTSTTVYNNASDGDTPISWEIITSANVNQQSPFECFDIVQWVPAGTYAASKIQATSTTNSLTVNDIWVVVEYLGSSYPLATPASTYGAGSGSATVPQMPQGSTPSALSTSGSWGTGALTNKYEIDVPSFTTSADGYVRFRVKVGKNTTIYVDPAVTVA